MQSITSVEYIPIRHLITFIAYKMNWSIVRVAEWLLARDYEQYATAYKKGEDSKFYEINNVAEPLDIATRYLLKQTLNIGHGAIFSEGKSEENKYFYKAYYKIADLNNHHILDKLDLNFNKIYDFNYSTDANGYVKAMDHSLIDNVKNAADTDSVEQLLADAKLEIKRLEQAQSTGSFMMGTPSVTSCEPKTDKERVIELEKKLKKLNLEFKELQQQNTEVKSNSTQIKNQDGKLVVYLAFILSQKLSKYRKNKGSINAQQIGEAITTIAQELGLSKDDMHGFKRPDARLRTLINENKELLIDFEKAIKPNTDAKK